MAMDLDSLFAKEAFTSLGPDRQRLFRQFAQDIEGKSIPEALALFKKLPAVSERERTVIIEAILESLPEKDKAKFGQIIKMIH